MGTVRLYSAQRKVKEHFLDGRAQLACRMHLGPRQLCCSPAHCPDPEGQWQDCLQPHRKRTR